jgi:O-antigen/teichoic acid export membrane protein
MITNQYKKYITQVSSLFVNKVGQLTIAFLIAISLGRYLGPERYGVYSILTSIFSICTVIIHFGLDEIFIKKIVHDKDSSNKEFWKVIFIKLSIALLTIASINLISIFYSNDITNYFKYLSIGLLFVPLLTINSYFESQTLSKRIVVPTLIQLFFGSIVKVWGIYTSQSITFFITVFSLDFIMLGTFYFMSYFNHKNGKIDFSISFPFREYFSKSWPLFFSSIASIIYMRLDQFILKLMMTDYEVGIYTAALKYSEAWYFIPVIIVSSFFPSFLKSSASALNQKVQLTLDFLIALSIIVILFVYFFSQVIFTYSFGLEFIQSAPILYIHVWTGIFVCFGVTSSKWMIAKGLEKHTFYRTFTGLILNLFLNIILIKRFGVLGAAYATLLSQFFATFIYDIFIKELKPIFYIKLKSIFFVFRTKSMIKQLKDFS